MDLNLAKTVADGAISMLENSLENKPTGLSRLLLAYGPESARQFIVKRRLGLTQLRHHEEMVEQIGKLLMEAKVDALRKCDSSPANALSRMQVEQLEKEYRLSSTFQKSLEGVMHFPRWPGTSRPWAA